MISKSKHCEDNCCHPLFQKKQTGHKKNDVREEDAKKDIPKSYDAIKNAVVGDSSVKKTK
jgi:hypothetical protein